MLLAPLTYKPKSPPRRSRQEPVPAPEPRSPTKEARPPTATQPQRQVTAELGTLAPLTYKPEPTARRPTREPDTTPAARPPAKKAEKAPAPEPQLRVAADVGILAPLTYKPEPAARSLKQEPVSAPKARSARPEARSAAEAKPERQEAGEELYSLAPLTYKPEAPVRPSRKEPVAAPEARSPQKESRPVAETRAQRKEVDADIQPLAPLTYKPPSPPRRLRKEQRTIPESRPPLQEVKVETKARPRPQVTRSATESQSPRKQSAVVPEPPSPRRQPWSATEARFPRQHIATPIEGRFPRQHIATPTEGYFPRQHIATPTEPRFPRKETRTAAVAQSHRHEARTSAVSGSLRQDARTSALPAPARQDARISALPAPPRQDASSVTETRKRNASLLRLDIPRSPLPISRFSPTSRSASPSTACSSSSTTPVSALPLSRSNDALSRTTRRQASPDSAISLGSAAGRAEPQHQYYERSPMLKSASCHTLRSSFNELERGRTRGAGENSMEMGQPAIHVTDTAPRTASYGHDRTGTADDCPEGRRVVSEDARVVRPPSWFPALKKAVSMEGPRLCIGGRFMQCDIIEEGGGHKDTDAHSIRVTKSTNNLGQAARTTNHRPRTSDGRPAVAAGRKDSIDHAAARGRGSAGEPKQNQSPPSRGVEYPARRPRRVDLEERDERGMSWLDL